ncbi:MAG TPA: aminotransferase class V-fold PLP-dependent enzyme, partial [Bacteroidetes bacterium]|nr:aminotransferase class V-fold PLP-dependent enzyme [Bacteroidota bacterium]
MRFSIFRKKAKTINLEKLPHDAFFNALISKEYQRVTEVGHTYLDFTGGNLFAQSQLDKHYRLLSNNVLGNPHSSNPTSKLATELVEEARASVLQFFKAEDYFCIFTQNATGALKIVGECYPFCPKSYFLLLADNHNSVNGIREYASRKKGTFEYCPIQYEDLRINENQLNKLLSDKDEYTDKLFAFPAQSNVSGVKHDLAWIQVAQDKGWDVLLDAAAYVPTSGLDLSVLKPDFVSISFYKIFGYPTGIGCLLIRKNKF